MLIVELYIYVSEESEITAKMISYAEGYEEETSITIPFDDGDESKAFRTESEAYWFMVKEIKPFMQEHHLLSPKLKTVVHDEYAENEEKRRTGCW